MKRYIIEAAYREDMDTGVLSRRPWLTFSEGEEGAIYTAMSAFMRRHYPDRTHESILIDCAGYPSLWLIRYPGSAQFGVFSVTVERDGVLP